MDSSIIIKATNSAGKKYSKAVSNINPAASNDVLKTFAEKYNGLSSDTFGGGTRVNKIDLNESGGGGATVTLIFDTSHYVENNCTIIDIPNGKRILFGLEIIEYEGYDGGYIDVTYTVN